MTEPDLTDTALFGQLGAAFGLNQTGLGRRLGLSSRMMSHVTTDRRRLPPAAYVALTHLVVALGSAPESPDTGHTPGPRWLARFEAEAREALTTSGPQAQARLALRRAALLHEAALTDRLLAGEALDVVVPR